MADSSFKLYPTVYLNPIKVFGSTCVTLNRSIRCGARSLLPGKLAFRDELMGHSPPRAPSQLRANRALSAATELVRSIELTSLPKGTKHLQYLDEIRGHYLQNPHQSGGGKVIPGGSIDRPLLRNDSIPQADMLTLMSSIIFWK